MKLQGRVKSEFPNACDALLLKVNQIGTLMIVG